MTLSFKIDDPPAARVHGLKSWRIWGPISVVVFLASLVLAKVPAVFDWPLTSAVNGMSNPLLDAVFGDLSKYATVSGLPLMAAVWACWFSERGSEDRAKLAGGVLIAFPAGIVSRLMQRTFDVHLRPFFSPDFGFKTPAGVNSNDFVVVHSFPSDHATVYAALVAAIFLVRPQIGWMCLGWLAFVELSRVYIGAHWPSDLIGGGSLAVAAVWATRIPQVSAGILKGVRWGQFHPETFYFGAFCLTYEVADLFYEVRAMVGHY
jgi:undecaprenyl-diphosphatase